MGALEHVALLTNRVIDVSRRSLRRHFPVVRGAAFDDLLGKLDRIPDAGRVTRQR
ncbi:hypothetical protein BV98_003807 [Sphingobium herbicidovorans NBRC 16415]|uniref:Uncharacterized protein n=1 Tax=Sphingobium herbicidovorans (strain ATCC 700291 / DSM 11019 / CCUG 56400 / KCTC 2939 / LMG 18315 / NBRC 16415 / MH) TaxID=1219045 RepID=A0A086P4T9_SPHHM|nr:hypothetical protein [Sphingobium herbicidovorans]KFG88407.1 hypothetical protein BV98_003807 [Sphingobium herbicidovorans NBRC 16415]